MSFDAVALAQFGCADHNDISNGTQKYASHTGWHILFTKFISG